MTIFNVISLAGGLALFLYGMSIMGTGLEKYAGGRMESILQKLTSSTWRAVALGPSSPRSSSPLPAPRSSWWAL